MKDWRNHEVEKEISQRQRNEWIEQVADRYGARHTVDTYVCECGDLNCSESFRLTRDEYESVRLDGARFVIAPNHENPEIERVTSENGRFTIVEKLLAAARMSRETNPRR